jgi:hypothetical protein
MAIRRKAKPTKPFAGQLLAPRLAAQRKAQQAHAHTMRLAMPLMGAVAAMRGGRRRP